MATIYQKDGQSVYDSGGQTLSANTGLPISSTSLAPTSSITVPSPDSPNASGLNSSIPDLQPIVDQQNTTSAADQQQSELLKGIADLVGSSQSQTSLTNMAEAKAGVPDLTAHYNEYVSQLEGLNNQATALQNEANYTIPNQTQEQATGRGITAAGLAPITASQLRQNQIKQGAIATQALTVKSLAYAAQGKLALAKDSADKAAQAQYEQQQIAIDAKKAQLDAIMPTLNREEKTRAALLQAQLQDRQTQITNAREDKKTILSWAASAVANGATPLQAKTISDANDLNSAFQAYAPFAKDPNATKLAILDLENKRLQNSKLQSEIDKNNSSVNSQGDTVQGLAQQLADGTLAPSELSKRSGGTANYNAILVAAGKLLGTNGKPVNIANLDRQYKYASNVQTQNTLNYLGSLIGGNGQTGNLDDLKVLSNSITRTNFPALNDTAAWARLQTGDPSIVAYNATVTEVADQIAKILQGGGTGSGTSDAKLAQAAALFQKSFSPKQVVATIDAIKPLLTNRAKYIVGDNPYLKDYAEQFGVSQQADTGGSTYKGFTLPY